MHACVCVFGCACACVRVAVLIQRVNRMRPIILSSVASLAPPYFSRLSRKGQDFREKNIKHKMCVLIFSTNFTRNISYPKKNSARECNKCENVFM